MMHWRVELYRKLLALTLKDFGDVGLQHDLAFVEVPATWEECMMLKDHVLEINAFGLVPALGGSEPGQVQILGVSAERDGGTATFRVSRSASFNEVLPIYRETDFATLP